MLGYVIAMADSSNFYIPNALYIKKDKSCSKSSLFADDKAAARSAERNGIELIYGMDNVPDGLYLDTKENREHINAMLKLFPKYKKFGANITLYANEKLEMLENDFEITITKEEEVHLRTLKSEATIDNYARTLLRKYL